MAPMPIALAGIGKIERGEHLPALDANPECRLDATICRNAGIGGARNFATMVSFLAEPGAVRTVSPPPPPASRMAYVTAG